MEYYIAIKNNVHPPKYVMTWETAYVAGSIKKRIITIFKNYTGNKTESTLSFFFIYYLFLNGILCTCIIFLSVTPQLFS